MSKKPRILNLKHTDYQPSKKEQEETFHIPTTPDRLAKALGQPVKIRFSKPKGKGGK